MSTEQPNVATEGIKPVFRQYFQLDEQIGALETQAAELKRHQDMLKDIILQFMRDNELDHINVGSCRFARSIKATPKPKLKDSVLENVLRKHLGGEDGRLRGVLEDIAQLRTKSGEVDPGAATAEVPEVLVRRKLRGKNTAP